ncbi:MAG TPA: hypothetical protein VK524_01625, partial [Polyangiaceae bacterium]|nr:hypothetical protein [Polyangiaceae bacterium]
MSDPDAGGKGGAGSGGAAGTAGNAGAGGVKSDGSPGTGGDASSDAKAEASSDARTEASSDARAEASADAGSVTVRQVAAGWIHTCALLSNGAVRCWGTNSAGQLGYGHTNRIGDDERPASAGNVNVGGAVQQIAAGAYHTCALLTNGTVRCWGHGGALLGYGHSNNIGDDEVPATAGNVNVGGTVKQITAGLGQTCALLTTGAVRCWGTGAALGYGTTMAVGDDETPASVGEVDVGGTVQQISAGTEHTCAVLTSGAVRCWGSNVNGVLGLGHTETVGDNETPAMVPAVNVGGAVQQIAAGQLHTCALLTTGNVRCWGSGGIGRLGYANTAAIGDDEAPASAGDVDLGGLAQQIAVSTYATCALLTDGAVRCWGMGWTLGYGN